MRWCFFHAFASGKGKDERVTHRPKTHVWKSNYIYMIERESYTYRVFRRGKEKKKARALSSFDDSRNRDTIRMSDFFQETGKTCILLGRHWLRNVIEKKHVIAIRYINAIIWLSIIQKRGEPIIILHMRCVPSIRIIFFLPKATYGIFAPFGIILSESFYFSFASRTMRTLLREEENAVTSYTTYCVIQGVSIKVDNLSWEW